MTVGRKQYNEADLLRMQHDAEERVREMQNRARQRVEESNNGIFTPQNRNWNSSPGMRRSQQGQGHYPGSSPSHSIPETAPEASQQEAMPPDVDPLPPEKPKKDKTIIGDIMDALGLDEDYLLIIGLILILINQRADTTLILALAYLLI